MIYPLSKPMVVEDGGFGSDPATYRQFGLIGHHGVDLVAAIGTPVFAPEDGYIHMSANGVADQYTGNAVAGETIVLQAGRFEHWLLHLSQRLVFAGNIVRKGQLIGYTGATGFVTGPHLHWGVRPNTPNLSNGYRGFVDPQPLVNERDIMPTAKDIVEAYYSHGNVKLDENDPQVQNYVKSGLTLGECHKAISRWFKEHGQDYHTTVTADAKFVVKRFERVFGVTLAENHPNVQVYVGAPKDYVLDDMDANAKIQGLDVASFKQKLTAQQQEDVETCTELAIKASKYDEAKQAHKKFEEALK